MGPFGIDLKALGELPLAIALIVVVLAAFYLNGEQANKREIALEKIRSTEREALEQSRREEREQRDTHWQKWLGTQSEYDRDTGRANAKLYADALRTLGDGIRESQQTTREQVSELSTTTRTEVSRLSDAFLHNSASIERAIDTMKDNVTDALKAQVSQARDTNAMIFRVGQDLQDTVREMRVSRINGAAVPVDPVTAALDHFAGNGDDSSEET